MSTYIPAANRQKQTRCQYVVAKKTLCEQTANLYPAANGFPVLCREHHELAVLRGERVEKNPDNRISDE